jgi:cytochrome P450
MASPEVPLDEINLFDPGSFERGEAHAIFKRLRRESPVHWNEGGEQVVGFWSVTKYADVLTVSRQPELFISSGGITQVRLREAPTADSQYSAEMGLGKMLITMDPPRHVRLRRLVNRGFTPRAVAAMEDHIRAITTEILDRVADKGRIDFVLEVAAQLPLAVICEMMGLERRDWPLMFEFTNKVLGSNDPEYQTDIPVEQRGTLDAQRATAAAGTAGMFGFFAQQIAARRASPGDDLISVLVTSEIDGEALTDEEILWFCFLLILAGNETTRNGISGGLIALCEHPAERARLQADMSLIRPAVEEILRWTSPVVHMAREATADTVLNGASIARGDKLVMWYPSVNRDEDVFPDPDTFDIMRTPNEHLAFGIGEHFCLGAGFARLELRVMFEELLRRFPDIDLDGTPERLRSTFIGGIKHMPVRYTPKA